MTTETTTAAAKPAARKSRKVGTVISNKMEKTVVVEVTRLVRHDRYGKFQKKSARFLADDRVHACIPGDVVEIEETRPLSARKRWRVRAVVTAARREG
ncbi:MAG: 30S ribosomal protein S17 [Thermoanaerobaculia bacterium]|nr:30S ribosomal protein S17 [Thermoanaerobaculia bacterium]